MYSAGSSDQLHSVKDALRAQLALPGGALGGCVQLQRSLLRQCFYLQRNDNRRLRSAPPGGLQFV